MIGNTAKVVVAMGGVRTLEVTSSGLSLAAVLEQMDMEYHTGNSYFVNNRPANASTVVFPGDTVVTAQKHDNG